MKKIVGFMVVGRGEADRYLERSLLEFARLCDDAIIVGNNTDEKTEKMIRDYGYWFYRDDREWGKMQPKIKTDLLEKVRRLNPNWILPLDADEVFSTRLDRKELERLMDKNVIGYYFYIINLWNDEGHYWKASGFWNIRFYQFKPELGLQFLNKNVHCGLAPPYAYKYGRYAPHIVKHFGLMLKSDRERKVERYKQYDPKQDKIGIGAYYEALKSDGTGSIFDEDEVYGKVINEVKSYKSNDKNFMPDTKDLKKFIYVRRKADGATLDMTEREWLDIQKHHTRKHEFEFVSEVNFNTAEKKIDIPIIEDEVKEDEPKLDVVPEVSMGILCPICGKSFESIKGLGIHKGRAHA